MVRLTNVRLTSVSGAKQKNEHKVQNTIHKQVQNNIQDKTQTCYVSAIQVANVNVNVNKCKQI